jgi:hypothetical protein
MKFRNHNHPRVHVVYTLGLMTIVFVTGNCLFFKPKLPNKYESKSAQEKENILWKIIKSKEGTQSRYPRVIDGLLFLNIERLEPSLTHFGDDVPYLHKKRLHSVGAVAKTQFVVTNTETNPFTGIFQTGSKYGLSRLSLGAAVSGNNFVPSIAIKFFRSNSMVSVNFFGMIGAQGQQGGNVFRNEFTNHLPRLRPGASIVLRLVERKFLRNRVTNDPFKIGLSEISEHYENGTAVEPKSSVNFPYRVIFVPNPTLTTSFRTVSTANQLRYALTNKIPSNTTLYTIYGIQSPTNGTRILIGEVITTTKPIYSKWGDEFLFFRHQRIEDDMKLRPEWKKKNRQLSEKIISSNYNVRRSRKLQDLLDGMTNNSQLMSMHSNVSVADDSFVSLCAFAQLV